MVGGCGGAITCMDGCYAGTLRRVLVGRNGTKCGLISARVTRGGCNMRVVCLFFAGRVRRWVLRREGAFWQG